MKECLLHIQLCPPYGLLGWIPASHTPPPSPLPKGPEFLYHLRSLHAGITGSPDMTPNFFAELGCSGGKTVGSFI